jgi:hypothetical protein
MTDRPVEAKKEIGAVANPVRIQRRRSKGWRMPPNTVVVDRSTKWGNPFVVGEHGTRKECVDHFARLMADWSASAPARPPNLQMAYRAMVVANRHELKGKNLACWCGEGPCHADVLLAIAELTPDAPVGAIR